MLAPSSSEDEDDREYSTGSRADTTSLASAVLDRTTDRDGIKPTTTSLQLPPVSSAASVKSLLTPASEAVSKSSASIARPISPSPSINSEPLFKSNHVNDRSFDGGIQDNRGENEEDERKFRLQLYVFVSRCVAYPFNAKQPTDMARKPFRMTKAQLQITKERFQAFLNGDTQIAADEAFINSIKHYTESFLKSERCTKMVNSGGCSVNDFKEIFRKIVEKRIQNLPEMDGLNKDTVMNSWLVKFETIVRGDDDQKKGLRQAQNAATASELIQSKDQLYDIFQNILGVKKFEHQLLFNALQLDNSDEQAAAIRRELDGQMQKVNAAEKNRKLLPKFVVKEMESLFLEELRSSINLLMSNLESLPVSKGTTDSKYGLRKFGRYNNSFRRSRRGTASSISKSDTDGGETTLNKLDVVLSFNLELIVQEVQGLKSLPPNRIIYCIMEVEGGEKLQTDKTECSKPHWDTQGDFTTTHPLPVVKIKLVAENASRIIRLDDKDLAKLVIRPTPNTNRTSEWNKMEPVKNCPDREIKLRLTLRMDRPQNLKCSGYLYALGKHVWKKWKKRFMVLVQVSQYTFAMCSYKERKSDPTEMTTLDGHTIDYTNETLPDHEGGRFFFNAVKDNEALVFASDDENERHLWVQAMYRATGQAHKPQPPASSTVSNQKAPINSPLSRLQGDADKARKHGMDEFIQADPCSFDHASLFKKLQSLTLDHRLNDMFASMGWFSPGQIFVLDEYCARYGVRGCHRHLCYLEDLLGRAERGMAVDPTLMHYSFEFCASHVHGNRPDGIGTVILAEKEKFDEVKERLRQLLEYQLINFRFCFPMGRPEGALKSSLSFLERVLMKDIVTPVPQDEVKSVIKKCLETAALVNYTKLSAQAKVDDTEGKQIQINENHNGDGQPLRRIEDILHLSELCIDLLQQNDECYAEEFKSAFAWFADLLVEHSEIFWSLFAVDLESVIKAEPPDTWNAFPIFQVLNDYLSQNESMAGGRFHQQLKDMFAPFVVRYVDLMESSIYQSIHKGFEKETWKPQGHGCAASEDMLWKLAALQTFISDLHWPDEVFAKHLEQRLKLMAADMIQSCVKRTLEAYEAWMQRARPSTEFIIPAEMCVMINVVLHFKSESLKLCAVAGLDRHQYHTKIDEFIERISSEMIRAFVEKFSGILTNCILTKLARYDEGTFFAPIFSMARATTAGNDSADLGRVYFNCMSSSMNQIRNRVADDIFILALFEKLYMAQMNLICTWLTERMDRSLHPYQVNCLSFLIKKTVGEFELSGIPEDVLHHKKFQTVHERMRLEEATVAVSEVASVGRSAGSRTMSVLEKAKKLALS